MEKESWLDPICKRDMVEFAYNELKLKTVWHAEILEYNGYGQVGAFAGEGSANMYDGVFFTPFALIDSSPYDDYYKDSGEKDYDKFVISNMFDSVFFDDCLNSKKMQYVRNKIICLWEKWIELIRDKNEGRKINGLTYDEDLNLRIGEYIKDRKEKGYKKVDAEIAHMQGALSELYPQFQMSSGKSENSEYDFSDICTSNANNDKPDIRNK